MHNLFIGWIGMAAGVLSGAVIGLFFHREKWLGGYSSFTRRMLRLGHIAFFGIGFLNILLAFTIQEANPAPWIVLGAGALGAANLLMPLVCFLSAWKKRFRHLFFVPVTAASWGIATAILYTGGLR